MITLKVPGMMCQMCVKRITKGFADENIIAEIDLATKSVKVNAEKKNQAIVILDDLGFDAEEIAG